MPGCRTGPSRCFMPRDGCGPKSMTLLKIARMGHPVLRRRAAPQVHVGRRLVVLRAPAESRDGEEAPARVLVNPEIEPLDGELVPGWEGCLSIPGLRGLVPRHARLRWRGCDLDGREVSGEAAGMHARVLQHEVDHLDGILYLDRMPDLRQLTFTEEMRYVADGIAGT